MPYDYLTINEQDLAYGIVSASYFDSNLQSLYEQQVLNSHKFITSGSWSSLWLGAPYFYQSGAIEIYRDGNKNATIDRTVKQTGLFGINFHRAGLGSAVDNWSAGCLVVADSIWFEAIKIFKPNQLTNLTLIEI